MVGDVYRCRIYCADTALLQSSVNTVYMKSTAIIGPSATGPLVAAALSAIMAPLYKNIMSSQTLYYGVTAQLITTTPNPVPGVSYVGGGAGTVGANILAAQVAGLISLKTAFSGRRFRGRLYLPFLAASLATATGYPTAGAVTAFQAIGNALLAPLAVPTGGGFGETFNLVLRSVVRPATVPPTYTFPLVASVFAPDLFATQRRRGNYGRQNAIPPI